MPTYIPYSPWTDAANMMSGVGQGIASVISQQPQIQLQNMILQKQLMMLPEQQALAKQHAALYGAQTDLAKAQATKAEQEALQLKGDAAVDADIGSTFSAIMSGDQNPALRAKLFSGLAHKAKTNPDQLATALSHMAAVFESGMATDPGMAQAMALGNRTYGNPIAVGGTVFTGTGDNFGPAYTVPSNIPAGGMRAPMLDYSSGQPVAMGQPVVNPRPAGQMGNLFTAALKAKGDIMFPMADPQFQQVVNQVVGSIPEALQQRQTQPWQPGMQLLGTNPPISVPAPSTNTPSTRKVRVQAPDGRTGSMDENETLPLGWKIIGQ